jgi:hypothetical protein
MPKVIGGEHCNWAADHTGELQKHYGGAADERLYRSRQCLPT